MSGGFFDTTLRFDGDAPATDGRAAMHEALVVAGLAYTAERLTFGVRVGAILDGHVRVGGATHDLEPGVVGALALDWRALEAPRDPLTLTLGVQLGASHARLVDPASERSYAWTTTDLRASVTASRTFDPITPYLAARVFGGPVFWRGASGGDTTHVQLAAGVGIALGAAVSLHLEGAALAERGLTGGVALAW